MCLLSRSDEERRQDVRPEESGCAVELYEPDHLCFGERDPSADYTQQDEDPAAAAGQFFVVATSLLSLNFWKKYLLSRLKRYINN